jgi:CelD/BcsL family acetyltransferase involved in cellulose biosynthesis
MLQVQVISDRQAFAALRDAWNARLDPRQPRAVFLTHEWFTAWLDAFAPREALRILVARRGTDVRGILPLYAACASGHPFAARELRFPANGHSPSADLVCAPGDAASVCAAFAQWLRRAGLDWDVSVFPEVAAGGSLSRLLRAYPESACVAQVQRSAPFIPLDGTWEAYTARLSKRFLKVLRNNVNRVEKSHSAEIERLESAAAVGAAFPDMLAISERSWQGHAGSGIASSEANRAFYAAIARDCAARRQLRLWFLKLDGRRVAFELHIVHAGVEFGLKTGFDLEFAEIGIGTYLDQQIVRRLFAQGDLHEYDLLGNADFYKLRWTGHTRDYERVFLFGGSWQARARSLWHVRLLPMLRQQGWLQELRASLAARDAAGEGSS